MNNFRNKEVEKIVLLAILFMVLLILTPISTMAQNETNASVENSTLSKDTYEENSTNITQDENNSNTNSYENKTQENSTNILSENQNETLLTAPEKTENVSESNESSDALEPIQTPLEIKMNVYFPEKITRGEDFEIEVELENEGGVENNLTLKTILPEGFDSLKEDYISKISPGEKITVSKKISSSISTETGLNTIKFVLGYKNG